MSNPNYQSPSTSNPRTDNFLVDDLEESERYVSEGPSMLPDDRVSAAEASELQARARDFVVTPGQAG